MDAINNIVVCGQSILLKYVCGLLFISSNRDLIEMMSRYSSGASIIYCQGFNNEKIFERTGYLKLRGAHHSKLKLC